LTRRFRAVSRAAAGLLLTLAPSMVPSAPSAELKGLWVVRTALLSPDTVDRVVDDAARGGFNALFVQVRGRGDAFYTSSVVGRSPLLAKEPRHFDPLARLLARARSRGLEVHAWINVLLTAHFGLGLPPGHVLRVHPEWVMVPRAAARAGLLARPANLLRVVVQAARADHDVEGYYISPSAPPVAAHLEEVVKELVAGYALDGLHLDFIRYPGPDYDYSRAALEGFRKASRGGGDLLSGPLRDPQAWDAYCRATVTSLVARLTTAARRSKPGLRVSAAVAPDEAQAVSQKFQDWPRWLAESLLDAICPMAYTPDSRIFRTQIENAVARTRPKLAVWAGIGAYRLTVDGTVEKIRLARVAGAAGVVVFSHESLARGDMDRLRQQVFPKDSSPGLPGTEAVVGR
jgi:uncharacterized lipoprotein YddW (UPF0748 family)